MRSKRLITIGATALFLLSVAGCSAAPSSDGGTTADPDTDTGAGNAVPVCSEELRDQLGYVNDEGESLEFPIQGWLTVLPPVCYFAMEVDGERGGYAIYVGDQVEAVNVNLTGLGFGPTEDGGPAALKNGDLFTYVYVPSQTITAGEGIPDELVGVTFTSFSVAEDLD
jgi:hypothetical protein